MTDGRIAAAEASEMTVVAIVRKPDAIGWAEQRRRVASLVGLRRKQ